MLAITQRWSSIVRESIVKSFHCPSQDIPTEAQTKLFQPSALHFIQWENMWGKTSLTPVFSRFGFHLEWTRMPHFSPSIVLSSVVLGDTCVCLTVVFTEMAKGMKVIQNEHQRRTANYEREEGWRGRSRRRRLVSSTATICPLAPSSHSPCLSTHFFCSVLSYLRCCVFSVSCL